LKTIPAQDNPSPFSHISDRPRHFGGACQIAGITVITIGVAVLIGWAFGIETLKRIVPEFVAMNPLSAVLLVLSGVTLLHVRIKANLTPRRKMIVRFTAAIIAGFGALRLLAVLCGWDIGIDQWLFHSRLLDSQNGVSSRMAPNTALNFLLVGFALLLIDTHTRKGHRPAEFLGTICAVSALLALLGYAYRVPSFYGVGHYVPMTLHTAVAFIALGIGILLARSDEGIAAVIASDTAGGIVARRLLPLAIVLPAGLGAFALEAGRRGSFESDFASVMHVTIVILLFLGLIWWMARLLYRLDTERAHHQGVRHENEERMREMAEHIGDVFWMTSLDGQLLFVSPSYEKVWGRSVQELYHNPWTRMEAIHPEDRERVVHSFLEESARGEYAEEYRILRPNGDERWIADRGFPVLNDTGEVYRIAGIASDVTKRKRSEKEIQEARSFLSSVVENIPHMIFIKDAKELRFIQVNSAAEKIFGMPREELFGKTDHDLFPKTQADYFVARDRTALDSGKPLDIPEEPVETANGILTLHARRIPMFAPNGEPQYLLGIGEDITNQKEAEQSIRQARDEAERANRSKSEFLSRMSHELRTPLNAILGFGQLLELDSLSAEQEESVRHIMSGGRHLLGLINEVLDIARIEAGRMAVSLEPVSLPNLLQDVAQLVAPLAQEREIRILQTTEGGSDLHAYADRQRLKQIFLNLLSNAIKYNRSGGEVAISTRRVSDETGRILCVRIEVADTGAGLSAEALGQLFTPFQRLGAEKTEVDGVGLGLALTKRLVELMDGVIGAQSSLGKGSTFWVELPTAQNPLEKVEAEQPTVPENLTTLSDATILYIEDNPSNLRLVERILAKRPEFRLLSTSQGKAGIQLAREQKPDIILLDLHLPDIHGHEVLARLRNDEATAHIPVIIVSADATMRQVQKLKESGAHDFLTKPIAVGRLLEVLDRTLNASAAVES
jgi:PAS domain S-box-containing protein